MNNLIPFDLTAALNGAKVITRNGDEISELHFFQSAREESQIVAIRGGHTVSYYKNGRIRAGGNLDLDHDLDLFMAPKPVEVFLNIYPDSTGDAQRSVDQSKAFHDPWAVSICKLTILNGEVISAETIHKY